MKRLIKEVVVNLGMDSETLEFLSRSPVYEDNRGTMIAETMPSMTPTLNHITILYDSYRQHIGKKFNLRIRRHIFYQIFPRLIGCWDKEISMRLLCLQMKSRVARNIIFRIQWRYYGPKGYLLEYMRMFIFWYYMLLYILQG